jgi:hypothetical protein
LLVDDGDTTMDDKGMNAGWSIRWNGRTRDARLDDFERRIGLLERELTQRIQREEEIGGFFAFLCAAAPRYVGFVGHLRNENRRLLRDIAALRADIHRASDAQLGQLLERARVLVEAIESHESLEREVLRDALDPI